MDEEERHKYLAINVVVREFVPLWFDRARLPELADRLRDLPEIVDEESAEEAANTSATIADLANVLAERAYNTVQRQANGNDDLRTALIAQAAVASGNAVVWAYAEDFDKAVKTTKALKLDLMTEYRRLAVDRAIDFFGRDHG